MTEILREPGRVANGLSTITARLASTNDDYIASITGGMGVIDKNTGELRSTFDILQDLSKAWENLTSVEKQELTETVAGKTQRSLFTAIMTNFDSAVGATEVALNSEGSAAEENEKRMDSLKGKVQQLQLAWQDLSRNTINSEGVKSLITFGTNILNLTNQIGGLIPVVTALGSAFLIFKSGSIAKNVGEMIVKFQTFRTNINLLKADGLSTFKSLQLGLAGVKAGTEAEIAATTGLATAMSTLAIAAGAAFAAISIGVAIYNKFKTAQEEAKQANIDEAESTIENTKEIQEKINKVQEETNELKAQLKVKKDISGSEEQVKGLEKEINKREENIQKMQEEMKTSKQLQVSRVAEISGEAKGGAWSTEGVPKEIRKEYKEMFYYIMNGIQDTTDNAGAYNRALKEQEASLVKVETEQKKYNQDTTLTSALLKGIRERIDANSKGLEEGKTKAEAYYNAIKGAGKDINLADLRNR